MPHLLQADESQRKLKVNTKQLQRRIAKLELVSGKTVGRVFIVFGVPGGKGFETAEEALKAAGVSDQPEDTVLVIRYVGAENGRPKRNELPVRYLESSMRNYT